MATHSARLTLLVNDKQRDFLRKLGITSNINLISVGTG